MTGDHSVKLVWSPDQSLSPFLHPLLRSPYVSPCYIAFLSVSDVIPRPIKTEAREIHKSTVFDQGSFTANHSDLFKLFALPCAKVFSNSWIREIDVDLLQRCWKPLFVRGWIAHFVSTSYRKGSCNTFEIDYFNCFCQLRSQSLKVVLKGL